MNVHVSENAERIIRSQVQSGRYASNDEVIEDALRRLDTEPLPAADLDPSVTADRELQQRLFAAGLLGEIKPSVRVDTGTGRFTPIVVEGESLSELIIRERR